MNATHEDWERVKDDRDKAARFAVYDLLRGNVDAAAAHARNWDRLDDRMHELAKELDRD